MTDQSVQADYDILIVGGGMVGASLACALGGQGLRIGVVEAVPAKSRAQSSYDERPIALAFGTRRIFEGMGVWDELAGLVTPIRSIHVSDRGHFGVTRLRCEEEGVEALGYVGDNRTVGEVLAKRLAALPAVDLICPATVKAVAIVGDAAQLVLEREGQTLTLTSRLVVAADGASSMVREFLGIAAVAKDYGQSAVTAVVTPSQPHNHIAYERFTENGPLAVLPMGGNRCGIVWTQPRESVDEVLALNDEAFLARLQACFGYRLGRLKHVGARRSYPLVLRYSMDAVRPRAAVIGNAAHALHPVAGQGFNLGLRDVAALAEVLAQAARQGEDIGDITVLNRYAAWRRDDHRRVIGLTDGLARLFSNALPPLVLARDLGMLAIDLLPPLKHLLARQSMGLVGRLPRLARGLPPSAQ